MKTFDVPESLPTDEQWARILEALTPAQRAAFIAVVKVLV
jgi:hypothetical protein